MTVTAVAMYNIFTRYEPGGNFKSSSGAVRGNSRKYDAHDVDVDDVNDEDEDSDGGDDSDGDEDRDDCGNEDFQPKTPSPPTTATTTSCTATNSITYGYCCRKGTPSKIPSFLLALSISILSFTE